MGKWYTAISDFRKGQQMQKKPPLFKKLFNAGSVEEEALQLLLHEKKIIEQEKELQALLNFRYGCLLYTSPSPRDRTRSRMPSSA